MGVKRGAFESKMLGNVWRPDKLVGGVPSLPAGAGLSAMAGAMRARGNAAGAPFKLLGDAFDAAAKLKFKYDSIKRQQEDDYIAAHNAYHNYKDEVATGKRTYDASVLADLESRMNVKKKALDSFWTAFGGSVQVEGSDQIDASQRFADELHKGDNGWQDEARRAENYIRERYLKQFDAGIQIGKEFQGE